MIYRVACRRDPGIGGRWHSPLESANNAANSPAEAVVQTGKPLLIVAEGVENEALATLVVDKLRGGLKVAAVGFQPASGAVSSTISRTISRRMGGCPPLP